MKLTGFCVSLFLVAGSAEGSALEPSGHPAGSAAGQSSVEFTNASGQSIGTVTKIGETTYYAAPDGTPLGTSSVVDGRRVFRSY